MSVDLSEFRKKVTNECRVAVAMRQLSQDDRDKLVAALSATDITTTSIWDWLTSKGFRMARATVTTHRLGRCICG